MNELINPAAHAPQFRKNLMATSAVVSFLLTTAAQQVMAEDADRPTVWIELGGQLERIDGKQQAFAPPFLFVDHNPNPIDSAGILDLQRPARYGFGGEGRLSFSPDDLGWTFTISARYGRSNAARESHQQTSVNFTQPKAPFVAFAVPRYANADASNKESHAIVDFTAGRDVGIGRFGRDGSSDIAFGVRFAQFSSESHADITARPDAIDRFFPPKYILINPLRHQYEAHSQASRSFRGAGPSVSWNASAALVETADDAALTFDWGVNAGALFGRQKALVEHNTYGLYYTKRVVAPIGSRHVTYTHPATQRPRSRSVIVPNVGGFAGFSFKFTNARVSLGYRADAFFGAMDGGIDNRANSNRAFYGPFATISIGLGG
jgi:hypothetical protein